jgi:hypothetical protein
MQVVTAFTLLAAGCVSSDDAAPAAFDCPDSADFPLVSQVVERRCGTLDCHGDPSRPLRIYGRSGLRLDFQDPGNNPDVTGSETPTNALELEQNRASLCGLEPEKMAAVVSGDAPPETLTIVRKPRLTEAHKGGRVFVVDQPGDRCLLSWLEGDVDTDACVEELQIP